MVMSYKHVWPELCGAVVCCCAWHHCRCTMHHRLITPHPSPHVTFFPFRKRLNPKTPYPFTPTCGELLQVTLCVETGVVLPQPTLSMQIMALPLLSPSLFSFSSVWGVFLALLGAFFYYGWTKELSSTLAWATFSLYLLPPPAGSYYTLCCV